MPLSAHALLLFVAVAVVATLPATAGEIEKLFVLHRHGARTPIGVAPSGKLLCTFPFCQLTAYGKAMCRSLGTYLRATYGDARVFGFPPHYNVTELQSVSTSIPRVVVSGEAAVLGLYPDAFPFVDFVPVEDDLAMSFWTSWPTWQIRGTYDVETARLNPIAETMFDSAYLQSLGAALGIPWCDTKPSDCISLVYDAVASNISNNVAVNPVAQSRFADMRVFLAAFYRHMLGYDPNDAYKKDVGAYGHLLGQEVMQLFTSTTVDHFPYRFFHRAAHDWTVFPFYGALGAWNTSNWNDTRWAIRFAEAVVLELRAGDSADSPKRVRASWGKPEQTALAEYHYTFEPLTMRCVAADGAVTFATECELDDLWRQINSTGPAHADALCYATQPMMEAKDCDTAAAPAANNTACAFYRARCPHAQCGTVPNSVADAARDLACVSLDTATQKKLAIGTIVAVGAGTLVVGAVLGYLLGGALLPVLRRWCKSS